MSPIRPTAPLVNRTCPKCRHQVAGRAPRCVYCGAALEALEARPARTCPRCSEAMTERASGWVSIDLCGKCEGEFYDLGELDRGLKLDDAAAKWLDDNVMPRAADTPSGEPLTCPGCAGPMCTFLVPLTGDLKIDICRKCRGTWLDKGEPARLRKSLDERKIAAIAPVAIHGVDDDNTYGRSTSWIDYDDDSTSNAVFLGEVALDIIDILTDD